MANSTYKFAMMSQRGPPHIRPWILLYDLECVHCAQQECKFHSIQVRLLIVNWKTIRQKASLNCSFHPSNAGSTIKISSHLNHTIQATFLLLLLCTIVAKVWAHGTRNQNVPLLEHSRRSVTLAVPWPNSFEVSTYYYGSNALKRPCHIRP